MNKKVLLYLMVGVILIAGYYCFKYKNSIDQIKQVPETADPSTSSIQDCVGVCASFDPQKFFEAEESIGDTKSYTDSISGKVIKFKLLTDKAHQTRNPSFEVYVNEKLAGTVGGQGISQTSFSPNHKYFAFRMRSTMGCAGGCQSHTLYAVNLDVPLSVYLLVRPGAESEKNNKLQNFDTFIESYSWGVDNTILPTAYPVGLGKSGKYYRVSSKEVWSFNLSSLESVLRNGILVNTIPE